MSCFHCSYPERKGGYFKHRFTWNFFSQSSSASTLEAKKSSPASQTGPCAVSEPIPAGRLEGPFLPLPQSSSQRPPDLRVFTYVELRAATKNFSCTNLLGEGGFGCVYKGILKRRNLNEEDMEVAVKQLNLKGQQGHKEWLAEVRYLGLVEHPNLVKLVGYCAEDDERGIQRLLVYEYMPNKSLEDHLFRKVQSVLSWQQRLSLMLGAARGLAYLHEEIDDMQVIFRDFKTSNVLLDADFTPKLSDFGLARQGPEMGATHVSTAVVGTLGYAAPEYIQTGHLTSKSDVWSFGVVLLEILTGRRALDRNRPKHEQQLIDWVKPKLHGNKRIRLIMDPRLEGEYFLLQAQKIASLAFQCLGKHARTRPLMSSVVKSLNEIVDLVDSSHLQPDDQNSLSSQRSRGRVDVITATKDLENAKKRKLLYKDVMSLKSREEARDMWRVWTPKPIAT
ncbi:hypothetical protein GOP47_0003551 [Adiantum capillus-veneris]|uniref:non-specific serine/threonine protein kinase n=1 Tax=Adiantum capillus-veneris TaxID=13818 RepID=A0A9D4VC00_ADICA|nr:hypothetical protein GOP47_0003175 [Adiantum capillus-veneris]KAI5083808.1 hypothetical protein GOP47_0003551 [Adiantum capillus-veneris]